ncbi:MAG: chorismate-binding protein, partial [Verrucomicrobia bacterium]|nr:chorismate-binding protein [Verrucomicrobiota bacterium]
MPYPQKDQYVSLASEYDIVPVFVEILADMETPVSVLRRFAENRNAFLLESMEGGEKWGRYSYVGVDPELSLEAEHTQGASGSLEGLRSVFKGLRVAEIEGLPRFCGGVVGFAGYESMCEFERMPIPKPAVGDIRPVSRFLRVDQLIVFDNVRDTMKIVICTRPRNAESPEASYAAAQQRIQEIVDLVSRPLPPPEPRAKQSIAFESTMTRDAYEAMVSKAREYIVAGDIIQVVLSQRFSSACHVPAFDLYRALRLLNPSPYTFFVKIGDQTLVGSSPEVMVRLTGNRVELRPIAGTRPRGRTEQQDRQLADELLADEKEKAEHVMLVDLGRNDLGRVSEAGSVQVSEYMV